MCRQYYLACRHRTCPNHVKTLHKERCEQPECEITYHRARKWNRHKGSRYCAACEQMGPKEWARRRSKVSTRIRTARRREKATIELKIRNEKYRVEQQRKAEEEEKKDPHRVKTPHLKSLWGNWCTQFFGNKPNLSNTAANLPSSPNPPVQQTHPGRRSSSNEAPAVIDLTTDDGERSSPAVSSDGEMQVE